MPSPSLFELELGISSGNDLLSRKLYKHYHRRYSVSLPCSGWERVGPLRKDHQRIRISNLKFQIPRALMINAANFFERTPPALSDNRIHGFSNTLNLHEA
jgi:hypothetical protein